MVLAFLLTVVLLVLTAYFFSRETKSTKDEKVSDENKDNKHSSEKQSSDVVQEQLKNSKESIIQEQEQEQEQDSIDVQGRVEMRVVYGSTTGTAKKFTDSFTKTVTKNALLNISSSSQDSTIKNPLVKVAMPNPESADGADPWDMLESSDDADEFLGKTSLVHIIIMSTWSGGVAPLTSQRWFDAFQDMSTDFRVGSSAMHGVRFAVYGLGSSEYDEHWCTASKQIYDGFLNMGATPLVPFGKGDDTTDMTADFEQWCQHLNQSLTNEDHARVHLHKAINPSSDNATTESDTGCCGGGYNDNGNGCGCGEGGEESNNQKKKKKGPKVIKGVPRPKRTKEERRVLAASKGDRAAAAVVGDIEASKEDLENDRLLRVADLEDSDEDSELEEETNNNKPKPKSKKISLSTDSGGGAGGGGEHGLVDVEDMGKEIGASNQNKEELKQALMEDNEEGAEEDDDDDEEIEVEEEKVGFVDGVDVRPEMVTPLQRKALTKEGYKIIGTHSAVKLCRWTKHQLRGRGGCYKHTFYGITSYQCMEATPSLACANKCVFCWRHHKNPVGREWRWKEDAPDVIVQDAISLHTRMVNEFKGAKGVHSDRIKEAMTVRHCALSLVGEPIMYPKISELCTELHKRDISTFLVTNAQFPEEIAALVPVTQLYVSIDAATKDSLKAVDRPLFKDYWERFLGCLDELKKKGQRTVYRLTLVKQWNMDEVDQYVELLLLGEPDLIEIKAVTFCGTSDASSLTMENVPWHHEVVTFAKAIEAHPKTKGVYGLASVHAHSCCTLLAKKEIYFTAPNDSEEPRWRTWIDYGKFHELEKEWRLNGTHFSSKDYLADTPHWALPDATEEGFDPIECRVRRNRKGIEVPIDYKSSESGCG